MSGHVRYGLEWKRPPLGEPGHVGRILFQSISNKAEPFLISNFLSSCDTEDHRVLNLAVSSILNCMIQNSRNLVFNFLRNCISMSMAKGSVQMDPDVRVGTRILTLEIWPDRNSNKDTPNSNNRNNEQQSSQAARRTMHNSKTFPE